MPGSLAESITPDKSAYGLRVPVMPTREQRRLSFAPMSIFDRIISGQLPASFVYRDERCVAFMDINPMTPGHVLVVPRPHVAQLTDLPPSLLPGYFALVKRVAAAAPSAPLGSRLHPVIRASIKPR